MRATTTVSLVRRLLTHEAAERQDQEEPSNNQDSLIEAAERTADKLRVHLSKRIGQEGFRTLLARALSLTTPLFPLLGAVSVGTDGSLIGLREAVGQGPEEQGNIEIQDGASGKNAVEGAVALLAHLLGLLISFIGEELTLRILGTVWPELALDGETGRENETP